jgi:MoaA/NifB/PqqE/SkfB family radical SAM enzyme
MTRADWTSALDQAADLGVEMVQFIGGEPTLHRDLPELIDYALGRGLLVEVFSNLVHVSPRMWEVFSRPGVHLATSYYTDDSDEHEGITRGRGSHARTRANIAEAIRRSVPLRAGVIDLANGQRVEQAKVDLAALGVVGEVRVDHLREVGRGVRVAGPDASQLCGSCGRGVAAIGTDGSVWPCVISRWLPVGNVRQNTLADILTGPAMRQTMAMLAQQAVGPAEGACDPRCGPNCGPACLPQCWPTGSGPCGPKGGCMPNYD